MVEIDLNQISESLEKQRPPELKETLEISFATLKKLQIPRPSSVIFVPMWRLKEEESELDKLSSPIESELKEKGIRILTPKNGLITAVSKNSNDGMQIYVSAGHFGAVFAEKPKKDLEAISTSATLLSYGIAYLALESAAKEIELPLNERVSRALNTELEDSLRANKPQSDQSEIYDQYIQNLKSRLLESDNVRLVGKGYSVQLRSGEATYLYRNSNQQHLVLQILAIRASNEFIKEMQKKTKWYLPPEKWSFEWQELYNTQVGPSPDSSELDAVRNGDVRGINQLHHDFLSSRLASLAYEALRKDVENDDTSALLTMFANRIEKDLAKPEDLHQEDYDEEFEFYDISRKFEIKKRSTKKFKD